MSCGTPVVTPVVRHVYGGPATTTLRHVHGLPATRSRPWSAGSYDSICHHVLTGCRTAGYPRHTGFPLTCSSGSIYSYGRQITNWTCETWPQEAPHYRRPQGLPSSLSNMPTTLRETLEDIFLDNF